MKIFTLFILLIANIATVHSCRCYTWDNEFDDVTTERCCHQAKGYYHCGDCPAALIEDKMWEFGRCCYVGQECSDCKTGCYDKVKKAIQDEKDRKEKEQKDAEEKKKKEEEKKKKKDEAEKNKKEEQKKKDEEKKKKEDEKRKKEDEKKKKEKEKKKKVEEEKKKKDEEKQKKEENKRRGIQKEHDHKQK